MKILMIEDNEYKRDDILRSISKFASENDVNVFKSRNSGLRELYSNKNYDLIILDMQFPICDYEDDIDPKCGLSVLAELQRKNTKIPVIICSSTVVDCSRYDIGNLKGYIKYDPSVCMVSQFEELLK